MCDVRVEVFGDIRQLQEVKGHLKPGILTCSELMVGIYDVKVTDHKTVKLHFLCSFMNLHFLNLDHLMKRLVITPLVLKL